MNGHGSAVLPAWRLTGPAMVASLLGLPGFTVLAVSEYGCEVEVLIETTEKVTGCPGCGVLANAHGRRQAWVRDLPVGRRAVVLVWHKRLWRCQEVLCPVGTWTESSSAIRPRAVLTERTRVEACRRVGQDAISVA